MYTDAQIQQAFDRYCERTDAVRDVLRLAPLNANGIEKIVHSGERFMIVEQIRQTGNGGLLAGVYQDEIRICTELLLQKNPEKPRDSDFTELFASIPLEVEENPFLMVAYHGRIWDYVVQNTRLESELPKAKIVRTAKGALVYLAREEDINGVFPFRAAFKL